MSLISFDPDFNRFEQSVSRMFDDFLSDFGSMSNQTRSNRSNRSVTQSARPAVDVFEDDKALTIHAELPGVKKEDIHLDVSGNALTLSGETRQAQEFKDQNTHYQERRFGSFNRSFPLGDNVDKENVQAKFEDGVLSVTLPKVQQQTRKITIN
ncbi:hypothetical protein BZG36_04282 [Bifiguratus adelaidae]|uniref:SHSP domain-containing protein n=1 Tax=Bifiguratus adelaidae TaxID=1938954 RepID=A0A261XW63_9FUNG|nr:hypothetical protein BZG36_04282 [Bifiguratus adelaidae]